MFEYKSFYLDNPIVIGRAIDIFEPTKITKDTALFIVHGGGWRAGSRGGLHKIVWAFREKGYIVASTDYRLYAKDAFEQLTDIRATYDLFVSFLKKNNRPLKIAIYGESAGAHLASLLAYTEPNQLGEQNNLQNEWVKPECALLQSTPIDFCYREDINEIIWKDMQSIAGVNYQTNKQVYEKLSLKNHINNTNPRTFFMEAEIEDLFPGEHTRVVVDKHRQMGIDSQWKTYPQMEHGFFYELVREQQKVALEDACLFMDGKLKTE